MKLTSLLFLLLTLLICNSYAQSPTLKWAKQFEVFAGGNGEGYSVITDVAGNVYSTGFINTGVDVDPGQGTFYFTNGGMYISKLDSSGSFVWAKQIEGAVGYSIVADANGNIYVTGGFYGTTDFDPGTATFYLTSSGNEDIFIAKFDSFGNFIWAKQMGGSLSDEARSIKLDPLGNVYTTGSFQTSCDFDPGLGIFNLVSSGGYGDIFISKLNGAGDFIWAKKIGGASYDKGLSLTVDTSGNVFTTGWYEGMVDFDPGPGIFNLTNIGSDAMFISKLDASGNFVWAKSISSSSAIIGFSIAVDVFGNVITTGYFSGLADFDPGSGTYNVLSTNLSQDVFILKLNPSGDFVWSKTVGGPEYDIGQSICLDQFGNIYVTGNFTGSVDLDPSAGIFNLTSTASSDIFILELNNSGNLLWAKGIGGVSISSGSGNNITENAYSISVDSLGNIYTTGSFEGITDFDPDLGIFNLTSTGFDDIFIQKMIPCQIYSSQYLNSCNSYIWNGTTYTTSGQFTTTVFTEGGCDSISVVSLNILNNSGSTTISACNNFNWNGVTYTTSGIITHTYTNISGCDSVHFLNLSIHNSSSSTLAVTAFNSYLWPLNGITYTNNGVYTHTTINSVGCDSIVTLNLTILQIAVSMTIQNIIQTSSNVFQYDVILTNNSYSTISLKGYSCGINHAIGMRGTGALTHTFISRDPSLSTIPPVSPGYTASGNHLRFITSIASPGNEVNLLPGNPIRLATMQVTNTVAFPSDFNPALALQMLTATGKTLCIATCIVSPPGTTYNINASGNLPIAGTMQALTGIVNTPCFFLNPASVFNATSTASTPVMCYGQSTGTTQIYLSGLGSTASNVISGTYKIDGGVNIAFTGNPFTASNISAGIHVISVTTSYGCTDTAETLIIQPSTNNSSSSSSSVTACNSYLWNGTLYTVSGTPTHTYINSAGCDSVHSLNLTIHPNPVVSASNVTKCIGGSVDLEGFPLGGIFSLPNPYNGPATTYTYNYTDSNGCSSTSLPAIVSVDGCNVDLHLKLFYQGYFAGASTMPPVLLNQGVSNDSSITDTILIELHSPLPPYGLVLSKQAILHTNGNAVCTFNYVNGNYYLADSYYVAIKHRNGLTTWSFNPIAFTSTSVNYDFTSSSSQAYGDNMTEVEPGIWAFYTGELNYDENIDLLDNPLLENDINNFQFGYFATDLNGDGNCDLLDVPTLETNIFNFVFSYQPSWTGTLPTITTSTVSSIVGGSAVCGGNVTSNGGSNIMARGVCWSMNPHPTIADSKSNDGTSVGSFTSNLTSLNPNKTYYVRAYVTNEVGTVYGNELSFVSDTLSVGQNYQGGIVAYILQPGDIGYIVGETHGIIAAPTDQGTAEWGCQGTTISGADGTSIGTGAQNTLDILSGCSTMGIAGRICADLVLNGYSDWFLPSEDELNQLYIHHLAIGGFTISPGYGSSRYWSSSEYNFDYAWLQDFFDGQQTNGASTKNETLHVRAIRSF